MKDQYLIRVECGGTDMKQMFRVIRETIALGLITMLIGTAGSIGADNVTAPLEGKSAAFALQEASNTMTGPGAVAGITYIDRQNPGSMGRMIGWGYSGLCDLLVHMVWVHKPGTFFPAGLGYGVYECNFGLQSGYGPFENGWESAGIDVAGDNRAVAFGHTLLDQVRVLWDNTCGDGSFPSSSTLPDYIWPHAVYSEAGFDTILHVVALSATVNPDGSRALYHWRRVGGELTGTWDVSPTVLDTVYNYAHDVVVSPYGGKVAVVWMAPRTGASDLDQDNDLYYALSPDNGATWGPSINVTNNIDGVIGHRPDNDLSVLIDSFDDLHITWSDRLWPAYAPSADTIFNRSRIAHWSENDPFIRTVHDADWPWENCNGGVGAMNVAKVSLSECNGNLYTVFVQFNDVPNFRNDDCADRAWSGDPDGAANGELYVSISSDRGVNWDDARNLTNTYTPYCDSASGFGGRCGSEHWVSVAPFGTDISCSNTSGVTVIDPSGTYSGSHYLDVQYIDDPIPGSYIDGEGGEDGCDVRWFRLACVPPSYACDLTLIRPEEGETFFTGVFNSHDYLVLWDKTPATTHVNIQLSLDNGGSWSTIASNVTGESWLWTLDPGDPESDNARLRVVDAANSSCLDDGTGPFTISSFGGLFKFRCQGGPYDMFAQAKGVKSTIVRPAPAKDGSGLRLASSEWGPFEFAYIGFTHNRIFVATRVSGCMYSEFHDVLIAPGTICDLNLGDFDNDGYEDIVVTEPSLGMVLVYLNRGDYTFHDSPIITTLSGGPCGIEVGDADEDGNLDLFVERIYSGDLFLLYGTGDGGFVEAKSTIIPACDPCRAALGYFNDDDHLDVSVARAVDNGVSIWLGNGSGGFTQQATVSGLPEPADLIAVDFNLDRMCDIGIIYDTSSQFTALINSGSGSFSAFHTPLPYAGHSAVEAADFTGDGVPDVMIALDGPDSLIVLPGIDTSGAKSASAGRLYFSYPTMMETDKDPIDLEVFDHNGDSIPDLLILTPGDSTISIYEGGLAPIVPAGITLTSPNGGETWVPGTLHSIEWFSGGIVAVDIAISRDNGATWQYIAHNVNGTSYQWTVTEPTTSQALILVADFDSPSLNDGSDGAFTIDANCCNQRGDANGSGGSPNVSDITYLVSYLFMGGPPAPCADEGDTDNSGEINVSDLTYLVGYVFQGGPPPPPC